MKFWTILWITFMGGPYDGEYAYMIYPSLESCEAAIKAVTDTLEYDYSVECEPTEVQSSSIRPKRNPRYE